MSFDTAWLYLREPADHAARDAELLREFVKTLPTDRIPRITDLGSGTGSTHRAVAPLVPKADWLLTDNDPALLAEARRRAPDVRVEQIDLSDNLDGALAHESDAITASALIDLVSAEWLDTLVGLANGRTLYIALTYDGREAWAPHHEADTAIFKAFEAHQRGDKGFGPSLGSQSIPYLQTALTEAGYAVRIASSAWKLKSSPLMAALAEGIASAAAQAGVPPETTNQWLQARKTADFCEVGHIDLLAVQV